MTGPFTEYAAGDIAPHTGFYRVYHLVHRVAHEVVVREGDTFPTCKHCGDAVRFEPIFGATPEAVQSPLAVDSDFRQGNKLPKAA
jgi:hypothetical protein